ncbi:RNA polymerase sigma factor [Phycicoccus flavus]|uniref:RNA polymerase sigma factor n=1 Tax=Phycicoccus flavus TaxID=2502783 RepID=UPI000FEBA3F1|nr:sigma-70 family RNA polymerase sigma factor [Phycicoccus flavus]NHA67049.1 sigma-70 family RNA polymerase sigma factor [Phycicoccus flavus]
MTAGVEDVVAREAPRVLGALVRRHGSPEDCEDALQEALLAAVERWPREGLPDDPRAWLLTVARRRLVDAVRSGSARRRREERDARTGPGEVLDPFAPDRAGRDGTLATLLLCADPALSRASQVALTLRVVSGLSTAQVAAAFFVPERTMGRRLARAKETLRAARAASPDLPARAGVVTPERLGAVRQVLSVVFTEGYTCSSGEALTDVRLADEAVRLARELHAAVPDDTETAGLLALLLLTHARVAARTDARGDLVPLAEQDRTRWDAALVAEGVGLVERALVRGPVGPFQLQAAIAAVHAEAAAWEATDWPQILVLYRMLVALAPDPPARLGLAVAAAEAGSPQDGLDVVTGLLEDPGLARGHRVHAVHGQLLAAAGDHAAAVAALERAAALATSVPEQRHLHRLVARERAAAGE